MAKLSNPTEIKQILEKHGFHFSKALGQNFLIDDSVCPRMAEMCGADEVKGVIEIGPGIGVLTKEVALQAEKVCAIELDKRLFPVLEETLAEFENIEIIQGDALKIDLQALIDDKFEGGPVSVCANLPYYITSPLIMHLLESGLPIRSVTVMVQKEAAERICAKPGTKECGAVSASVHYHCEPEILFHVSRGCFMPPPKVDSAVIRLNLLQTPPVEVRNKKFFFQLVRASFSQRRKTAANSISSLLPITKKAVEEALLTIELPINIRAEKLTIENFAALSNFLFEGGEA
ncbi:16S rRNA (adenine(1518)-N(6)/adenine(1519)-N(6))-dimethyltransferase RsmA [Scatolibacter rhodanostii]|uniref:16S rRNA (adenine(1518)-N(6)/adenine(1519)-N(6))- dimethyltransferase RsmA n=1 Tax=Scatolibacter rhodanostii TaxID=2014781 RepID=UPI000C06E5CB|nr:16S rRNA (adenine(1518)-N(6)/adenine(1519)-N(6))-dimethyltransferase RsmA [Scatolibacter rhodanostii]